jgi:5-dehydro-2-deoxygluconokinase
VSNAEREYDLISMGRACLDLYANEIGVPFPEIQSFSAYVGGCPANIVVGAQRLGLKTAMLSAIGEDLVGDFVQRFLANEGIETKFMCRKPGRRTAAAVVGIQPPDKFPLVYYRGNAADIKVTIDDVLKTPIADSKVLLLSGTGLSREPSRSATIFAAEQARAADTKVFLDFDLRTDQWHDLRVYGVVIRSLLPLIDVAIGTEDEIKAAMLKEENQVLVVGSQVSSANVAGDLDLAIQAMLARGPEALAVKRGQEGSSVFTKDGRTVDAPGFPVEVYNTLGAGDAFASGFIYGYVHGWDWYQAARFGNATGAIVVTRHGCANFMAYEDEALRFVEEHGGF